MTSQEVLDVGVVGSVNRDTIHHADGRVVDSLGGVLFTACALAHLGAGRLRSWLLARVGDAVSPHLRRHLAASVPGLRLDGLQTVPGAGFHCLIRYDRAGHKTEVLSGDIPPLRNQDIAPYLERFHGVLVNFVTGFELDLDTLRALRRGLRGPLLSGSARPMSCR